MFDGADDAYGYFYPLDAFGYGNDGIGEETGDVARTELRGDNEGYHNFWFTTEVAATFFYGGNETFSFNGDDDLWLFINQRLALDVGGMHPRQPGNVSLPERQEYLGIEPGNVYDFQCV